MGILLLVFLLALMAGWALSNGVTSTPVELVSEADMSRRIAAAFTILMVICLVLLMLFGAGASIKF